MSRMFFPVPAIMYLLALTCGGPIHDKGSSLNRIPTQLEKDDPHDFTQQKGFSAKKLITCRNHGLQPSKDSCRTFYHCVNLSEYGLHWLAFRFTCPVGMFFDSQAKDCFWLDRWDSGHPECTEGSAAEVVTFHPGDKLEKGMALVVTSDIKSNSCEHITEEISLFSTSVSGYKNDLEFLMNEMPEICRAVANASNSLHEIKAKHFLTVPPSETIMFRNLSLEYNEDLALLQDAVDILMGEEGILKSLNRILLAIKEFESGIQRKLSEINTLADGVSRSFLPKIIGTEKKELKEITDNIKTCLNFSAYGYASQAIMTFMVDDLVEYQQHLNDSNIGEIEDYGLRCLEGFFMHVNDTSNRIQSDLEDLQMKMSTFLQTLWKSYTDFTNYRTTAVGALGHFHKERLQSLEKIDKTKAEVLKISKELTSKLLYLSSVPDAPKSSDSFFSFDRDTSMRGLVTTIHNVWHVIKHGRFFTGPRMQILRTSEQIQNHKDQVIHMNSELKKMNIRILMLERDIPILEEEMLRLRELEMESTKILSDSYWLVQAIVRLSADLQEIENILTVVIKEAQEDILRARRYHSGPLGTMTRLHLHMAIENLKWNWNNVSRDMTTIERCGAHK